MAFINRFFEYLRSLYCNLDIHSKELFQGASIALALKFIAAIIKFTFSVVLARILGAKDVGIYFLAFTVVNIAGRVGTLGLNAALVKFIAANAAIKQWEKVKGVYLNAIITSSIVSSILTLLIIIFSSWIANKLFNEPTLERPLQYMAIAIIPFSLIELHAHSLRGLKKISDSMLVLSILIPFLTLIGIIFLGQLYGIIGVVWSYIIAALFTLFVGVSRWKHYTPQLKFKKGDFKLKNLLSCSIPLFWVLIMQLFMQKFSIIILGIYLTSEKVGIFQVASRTAMFISYILIAVNSIAAPKIAELYREGKIEVLSIFAQKTTKLMTLCAFFPLALFILIPKIILSIFGTEFIEGSFVLVIIGIGQFINVSTGVVGLLLTMTGYEKIWRNVIIISAIFNISLNLLLIPVWNIVGAAIAMTLSISLQMLAALVMVWKKLGIKTLPINL